MFSPVNDFFEAVRLSLIPLLGALVNGYNELTGSDLYVTGATTNEQFVGRVDMSEEQFEQELQQMGFERNPLASLKRLRGTREYEEGSFRFYESDSDFQLHVIIYDGSVIPNASTGETYVYAHWEYRWDRAPLRHYRGERVDVKYGVDMMRAMLDHSSIEFTTEVSEDV